VHAPEASNEAPRKAGALEVCVVIIVHASKRREDA
jgi:hypothetical protein